MDSLVTVLRRIPSYKVIVPLRVEGMLGRRKVYWIEETTYPIDHLTYSYDEAVDVLKIFCRRWISAGYPPEEDLTPRARSEDSGVSFTLEEVEPDLFGGSESGTEDGEDDW